MVKRTSLQIVILWILSTWVYFELIKVQEHDALCLANISCIGLLDMWSNWISLKPESLRRRTHGLIIGGRILRHEGDIHGLRRLKLGLLKILLLHCSHLVRVAHCQLLVHFRLMHIRWLIVKHHLVVLKLSEGLHVKLILVLLLEVCELRIQRGMLVYLHVRVTPWYRL